MLLKETLKILKTYNIKLNKRKGQNYLVNSDILNKILDYAEVSGNDTILEIGAGIGTLTIPLAKRAKKVIAVEQDKKIGFILEERLEELGFSNVEVLVGDATKLDFLPFNKVVSNLPYKISSPITFKLLEYEFDFGILMYQFEFANRMVANPGDPNYSRLSLMLKLLADVEILEEVSKHEFFPNPKVSSAIIKLIPKKKIDIDEFFLKVSRALFQHKRKKVRNALLDSFHEIADVDKTSAKDIISNLDQVIMDKMEKRVVELEVEEIILISNKLKSI
ncbi:MAG: 16S ribosomal RNA methyltransferase A, partial [Euryarchaeota archaeon]|nr:16S ribosomal RNA methyltransferase A [Euryarchaeota archaeon]